MDFDDLADAIRHAQHQVVLHAPCAAFIDRGTKLIFLTKTWDAAREKDADFVASAR